MDEAEDLFQVLSLMSLLPNMVDCFKIISNYTFYLKLSSICQIEAKTLDLIRINKPQKNDNMELLFNYFNKFYECFLKEYFLPVRLKEEFFIQYCKLFLNEDLNKINILIKILKK